MIKVIHSQAAQQEEEDGTTPLGGVEDMKNKLLTSSIACLPLMENPPAYTGCVLAGATSIPTAVGVSVPVIETVTAGTVTAAKRLNEKASEICTHVSQVLEEGIREWIGQASGTISNSSK